MNLCSVGEAQRALSPKRQRFVEEYAVDLNGTAAAARAGYAARSAHVAASRLLKNDNVWKAVQTKQEAAARQLAMTRDRVIKELQASIEIARGKGDAAAMIRGWSEIAKLCGLYAPERKEVQVSASAGRMRDKFEAMTDEELLAIAGGAAVPS